jgi:citronellyl-CoA dehydrogenase
MDESRVSMQDSEIFTEDHQAFRKTVRKFGESLAPHAEEWNENGGFPREVFKQAGDLDLLGIRHGEDVGGLGLDWWWTACYAEELIHTRNAGVNMSLLVQSDMATPIINELGSDEVKKEFLEPAIKGEKIAAIGVSEPGGGSDVAQIKTTARSDGDDYIINGQKLWITNGTRADFVTLAVRTGDDGFGGLTFVVCPTDVKGYAVGKKIKKIGHLSSDTSEIFFDNVRIPKRYRLGEENMGFYHIMTNFQGERLVAALGAVAGMEGAVREAIRYGTERHVFGKPIMKYQVWQHKMVEHLTSIEAARRLTYFATDKINKDPMGSTREITMAKLFCGDLTQRVMYDCQQVYGGFGFTTEYPISRAWTDARLMTIGGGTSEVMKYILTKLEGL